MSKKITYPKFEINKSRKDHLFYWVLYSRNGKPILRSKAGYKTKQNAQKNIALVLKYGDKKDRYLYDTANISGNGFYFWLYGFKQFKNDGSLSKIAVSGNGKFYQSVNWQIAEKGVLKGIDSCLANITAINEAMKKGKIKIQDNTKK